MNEGDLIKLPCACKNLPIHPECLKEWLKCCPDILTCGVCKQNISPSFIQKFVNVEDLLMYPYKSTMSDVHSGFRTYVGMPGVPYAELVNGKMIFESVHKKAVFVEAKKRCYISERRSEKYKNERYMRYNN